MTHQRPETTTHRSTLGILFAAVIVIVSFWFPAAVATASPSGGSSITTLSAVFGTAPDGGPAVLTATLQANGVGVSAKTISFFLDGTAVGTAFTDSNGVATLAGVPTFDPHGVNQNALVATFAGDDTYASVVGSGDLYVGVSPQVVNFTSTAPSAPDLGDTYSPTATGGGSDNPVVISIDLSTTNNACSISSGVVTFNNPGTCVIDADQAGDNDYAAAPTAQQQIIVGKVSQLVSFTSTAPSAPDLGDTYSPTATGGGSDNPVVISIDVSTTNNACSISSGVVTFNNPGTCVIDADQAGDNEYSAAPTAQQQVTISAVPTGPTIRASVHSPQARTRYGWYSTPVTIRFTCSAGSSTLSQPCPGPVTLSRSGAAQHVSRTVSTVDDGTATTTVRGINIDRTAPSVTVRGVKNHGVYRGGSHHVRCKAHDAQSGVVRCSVRTTAGRHGLTRYTATAVNRAGLKTSTHGSYRTLRIWISKVAYTPATGFQLKVGTYTLNVASSSMPRYEWAAPANTTHPANRPVGGNATFTRAGDGLWQMTFHITRSMSRRYKVWNLGVSIHGRLHVVRVTVR
jgi:hypothetical protein